jgi:hypothetical protein
MTSLGPHDSKLEGASVTIRYCGLPWKLTIEKEIVVFVHQVRWFMILVGRGNRSLVGTMIGDRHHGIDTCIGQ